MDQKNNSEFTVFVGNLDTRVTEEMLFELFLQAGPLKSVKIPLDHLSKKPLRYGFVTFKHIVSVNYAIKLLNGIRLYSVPVALSVKRRKNLSAMPSDQNVRSPSARHSHDGSCHNNPNIQMQANRNGFNDNLPNHNMHYSDDMCPDNSYLAEPAVLNRFHPSDYQSHQGHAAVDERTARFPHNLPRTHRPHPPNQQRPRSPTSHTREGRYRSKNEERRLERRESQGRPRYPSRRSDSRRSYDESRSPHRRYRPY